MNIIVTGAGRGIGFELVKQLSSNFDNQIHAVSRNLEKVEALGATNVHNHKVDFLADDFDTVIKEVLSQLESVDVIINNAGYLVNKSFKDISKKELVDSYEVNVFAPFVLVQNALSKMGKGGHIVNISSMGGFQGSSKFPGLSAYSSSKAAISNLTELLAEELKEQEISVNCLALGAVQTEMLEEAFPGYQAPLKPAEMAKFIANFALNGSKFFNGKILPVSLSTP
jgi:NAD(P)-dependent dehydrogenase (short-subunit alcohol dehydrogenase family)